MRVAGVDGCKAGWLVVIAEASGPLRILDVFTKATFRDVLGRTRDCKAVAVDIPIGLSKDEYWRRADLEARRVLGSRASCVFPAPTRPTLRARNQPEGSRISKQVTGKGLMIQTFQIMGKICEVDEAMTPELQDRVFEVHPEVCFWKLNGKNAVASKKKRAAGKKERLAMLSEAFKSDLTAVTRPPPKGAGLGDFYDACAAAWTAARVAYGTAERLPQNPPRDSRGLRMEIVC